MQGFDELKYDVIIYSPLLHCSSTEQIKTMKYSVWSRCIVG